MVARHLNNRPRWRDRRHAKTVSHALHDQCRHAHRVELGEPAWPDLRAGPARRLKREGEAEHPDGAGCLCGPARHSCTRGSTSCDKRQSAQLAVPQVVDHRDPGGVELVCWRGCSSPGDAIWLLDKRDADLLGEGSVRHRDQVPRIHPSGGPVAEDQGGFRLI